MTNKLLKSGGLLIIFSILSKSIGFLREIIIAYLYGASTISDSYIVLTNIVNVIIWTVLSAVTYAYIPVLSDFNEDLAKQSKITSYLINLFFCLFLIVGFLLSFFSKEIIFFFAPGFASAEITSTSFMLKIILPFIWVMSTTFILGSFLQLKGMFWQVMLGDILTNLVLIFSFILARENMYFISLGMILSFFAPLPLLYYLAIKSNFKYSLSLNIRNSSVVKIFKLYLPTIVSVLVGEINLIIDKNFASSIGIGIMSNIQYANKLFSLFPLVFGLSISNVIFPSISVHANSNDSFKKFKEESLSAISLVLLFSIPVAIGIIVLSLPITEIAFMRGAFTSQDALITSNALFLYCLSLPALSLNCVLLKCFFALKETKLVASISIFCLVVNIILNFILVGPLGYAGLCISTSISTNMQLIGYLISLRKRVGPLGLKSTLISIVKMTFSAFIMGVVVSCFYNSLIALIVVSFLSKLIVLLASVALGCVIYFAICHLIRIPLVIDYLKIKTKH